MSSSAVSLKCSCGSEKFEFPKNPKDSDTIKCSKCGASGTYGQVMRDAAKKVKSKIEKDLKDAFRKAGFK